MPLYNVHLYHVCPETGVKTHGYRHGQLQNSTSMTHADACRFKAAIEMLIKGIAFEVVEDYNPDTHHPPGTPVRLIRNFLSKRWGIVHAATHQNAFRNSINSFKTKTEARRFAVERNCNVVN